MTSKSIKKIGIFCLCLASLSLAGCFHVPDEDWLLSNDKNQTGNNENIVEVDQTLNEFVDNVNNISDHRNEIKNSNNS